MSTRGPARAWEVDAGEWMGDARRLRAAGGGLARDDPTPGGASPGFSEDMRVRRFAQGGALVAARESGATQTVPQ